jgi:hypothetical protein
MEQKLQSLKRISGPASYYAFRLPESRNEVYLFGDYHFSYRNQCDRCDKDAACKHIVDFIQEALERSKATGTALDVYMEFPYVVGRGEARERVLSRVQELFLKDRPDYGKKVFHRGISAALAHIFGKRPQAIGIFSLLFKRFAPYFYEHAPGRNNQRFHYSDARFELNVKQFLSPTSRSWIEIFHQRIPTVERFRRLLEAFVLGHRSRATFGEQMQAIFGPSVTVFRDSLSRGLHKISKQVAKLPSDLRSRVESFIRDKLDGICKMLKEDVRYEDGVRLLATREAPTEDEIRDGTLAYIRASRLANYMAIFTIFMELIVQTLMMDTYLIARMLYYGRTSRAGVSIVYAGDYHIGVYADFLANYMGLRPLGCHVPRLPPNLSDDQVQALIQRCVQVSLGTCNMSSTVPGSGGSEQERKKRRPRLVLRRSSRSPLKSTKRTRRPR